MSRPLVSAVAALLVAAGMGGAAGEPQRPAYPSPYAVVASPDGSRLYVSHHGGGTVSFVDPAAGKVVREVAVGGAPAGLELSADGATLYVADAEGGSVAVVDVRAARVRTRYVAGRSAYGLERGEGSTLYVCDRFRDRVNVLDAASGKVAAGLPATREPLFCALSAGGTLCVANMLPLGPSLDPDNAAAVDLYDATAAKHVATLRLPSGATDVHQVACSPDGRWAYVVHVLARFNLPPTQLERGWVNNSALTILSLERPPRVLTTVLLDEVSRGSAVPFGLALSRGGERLVVSFFGTHELAVIDLAGLHQALDQEPEERLAELSSELSLLRRYGVIRRAPSGGRGPRGLALDPDGATAYVANAFSDNLGVVDLARPRLVRTIELGPAVEPDLVRRGEMLFNDATICFQSWQSCASCHPEGRADGLNWDLLNDGMGNPKNARSLLYSHRTPPVMASAVRDRMEVATRAGLRYILFRQVREAEAEAIDAYLRALRPRPSPYRNPDGSLTDAARRGEAIFQSARTGCASCHSGPLYTDLKTHDVGTRGPFDRRDAFDNPTLIEAWRTGPYLHDGRAVTLRQVLTDFNKDDRHGRTSHLTDQQLDDLVAFLLSL
ncbi:MAG: c-type cytochrome [Candidatus Brocadiia bacterium]